MLESGEHPRGDPLRLADKAEVDLGPDAAFDPSTHQLACLDQPAILAGEPNCATALGIYRRDELLVDRPGEDHLDHFHRLVVGDPQPVDDAALDAEPFEHMGNLRPAAVHDDRVDADLLQQHDIAGERIFGHAVGHGMAAIFDDQGMPGIAPHVRERLRQDGSFDHWVRVGGRGRFRVGIHRAGHSIAIAGIEAQNRRESGEILQCRGGRPCSSRGSRDVPPHGQRARS